MEEEWYDNATPEYKWLADVYGVKTKEELDKKVPFGLQDSLASLYNTSYSHFGNPDYDDYTLAAAYSNNDIKDEDLYNSIRNSGYEGLKFSDMTNDHWNKVLQNYMVGYNDFSSKHPHIPYSLRMENGYRASWDPSYEGYVGDTPSSSTTKAEEPMMDTLGKAKKATTSTPDTANPGLAPDKASSPTEQMTVPGNNINVAEPTTPVVKQPAAPATTPTAAQKQQTPAVPTTPVTEQPTPVAEAVPAPATPVTEQPAAATPAADPNSSAAIQQSQIDAMNKNIDPMTGKPIPTVDKNPDEFKYRFNWGQPGTSLDSMLKTLVQSKDPTSKRQIIDDYLRYMHDNNLPVDYYTLNDIVNKSQDLSLSPADDEKEKKRQANKERWDKVSNFLLHLGNAIGNVGGGGYASMKLEDPVQWGERQRLLKEKGLEQRRLNNQSILQQMHKNFTDARAQKVQQQNWEMKQRELNLKENSQKHKEYMDEYRIKMAQQKFDWQKEKDKLDRELKERQISQKDYALRIAALNASVNEYRAYNPLITTVEKTDRLGGKTTEKRTQSRGGNSNSNSTPPSRRRTSNTNNTPPSRRRQ